MNHNTVSAPYMPPAASTAPPTTWWEFLHYLGPRRTSLLRRLDEFPDAVLVTGCQRSGTTMLSRIITQSEGMTNYWFGSDDELSAALILSGLVDHTPRGRCCFQTTYVDERYPEYLQHHHYRMVWVLRNPFSTVCSMLYNYPRRILDYAFVHRVAPALAGFDKWRLKLRGTNAFDALRRACLIYNWKLGHLGELVPALGPDRIMVVDYDKLVQEKFQTLSRIFNFIGLTFHTKYCEMISSGSLLKHERLSERERVTIERLSGPAYLEARGFLRGCVADMVLEKNHRDPRGTSA